MTGVKIFGTGWQRTGTTSLTTALNQLGIPTRQYPWQLLDDPSHPILHRFQAFTDNPIPLLYQELDERFPGSRFIHTRRDEAGWLKSIEWLMTVGEKKFRFDRLNKGYEMFDHLYGRRTFDRDVFLERYQRHNREVRAYFADRPQDVLYLDITAGDGFELLCPFLELPEPGFAFPRKNVKEPLWRGQLRSLIRRARARLRSRR
jgi:hypothetical protein